MLSRRAMYSAILVVLAGTVLSLTDGATVQADTDPVVAAVGDMACDPANPAFNGGVGTKGRCAQSRTSDEMLSDTSLQAVLGLGDYQYECGASADYAASYDPTWGRLDALLHPTPGNHEYKTGTDKFGGRCPSDNDSATAYFTHFGSRAHPTTVGHFSFDLGSWHLVALNGNCRRHGVGGCSATSAQTRWLVNDLQGTDQPCIAAFWHQPRFAGRDIGQSGTVARYRPWWDVLYAAHADVVLNGHVHNYQRYVPLRPRGVSDPTNGITEYVVGTGGEPLVSEQSTATVQPAVALRTFGYLRMHLHATGWNAQFVDSTGQARDRSSGTCHPK